MFDLGRAFAAEGKHPIDLSLGNPTVKPPTAYYDALQNILTESRSSLLNAHAYMPNAGYPATRARVAADVAKRFGLPFTGNDIIMTVGAANALDASLRTAIEPVFLPDGTIRTRQDDVIVTAPYFVEYDHYIKQNQGRVVVVHATDQFMLNVDAIEVVLSKYTAAILINSPNNPTGAVYDEQSLQKLARILQKKEQETGHTIAVIEDCPYDQLIFQGHTFASILPYYKHTLYVTSLSKSLGIAGERIGFIAVNPDWKDDGELVRNALVANMRTRVVNAPALPQRVIERIGILHTGEIRTYEKRINRLADVLKELHFRFPTPQAAFYLFAELPPQFADEKEFRQKAHEGNEPLLYTPGAAFGSSKYARYVRFSACASDEEIERAVGKLRAICHRN